MPDLAAIQDAAAGFWALGSRVVDLGTARWSFRSDTPSVALTNTLDRLRPTGPTGLDDVLARAAATAGHPCRRILLDRFTPDLVAAELVARDWRLESQLQLVLPAGATGPGGDPDAGVTVRTVGGTADWDALHALFRADHEEEDRRAGRSPRPERDTEETVRSRRGLVPPAGYLTVERSGEPVAMVGAWPGDGGPAVIEDVFVRADHRHRGLATTLLAAAVRQVRVRGAGPVLIAALPDDTPKHLYARAGFRPAAVTHALLAPASPVAPDPSPTGHRDAPRRAG